MSEKETEIKQEPLSDADLFREGQKDSIPVALGYFAVSFALGIAMRNAGIAPFTGFVISFLNMASAGEYAGTTMIAAHATLIETGLMVFAANARYLLMSTAFSQKFDEKTPVIHRYLTGFVLTDELFALAIRRKGYLQPFY
ncbi:MAG: AzlC family ABC transporter permease, partial [Solobacterium sp.]|nr:AzlC family ABC transporter permease [Solobacterium sp.]